MTPTSTRPVHLVGAVGLDTVPETFETLGRILGDRMRRAPDGEPGGRRMWIAWQFPLLRASPYLQAVPPAPGQSIIFFPYVKLAEGVSAEELRFGELGYAREAMASYAEFKDAKAAGQLPAGVRFQVSLPTPYAVIQAFAVPEDAPKIEPAYEKAMLAEVAKICSVIPHSDLAIQWDVCPEMVAWDGRMVRPGAAVTDPKPGILQRLKRISDAVPADVELGYHLCYGDVDGKHFIEPLDSGKLVELANALAASVERPINWIHMPVPIERSDEDYFRPLAGLKLDPGTELYLGCVHGDGVEATRERIEAASKYAPAFGIATECGMGRCKTPEVVVDLLEIHAAAS